MCWNIYQNWFGFLYNNNNILKLLIKIYDALQWDDHIWFWKPQQSESLMSDVKVRRLSAHEPREEKSESLMWLYEILFRYYRDCVCVFYISDTGSGAEDGFSIGAGADGVPAGLQKSQVTIRGHESIWLYGWTHGGRQRRSGDSKTPFGLTELTRVRVFDESPVRTSQRVAAVSMQITEKDL